MPRYKSVRSLKRGLDVLRALNVQNGVRVQQISAATGIHRATIHRLLETLCEAGFVAKSVSGDVFFLTERVQHLSEGFRRELHLPQIVRTAVTELQRRVQWPTNFATFQVPAMVIQETTHNLSPFSVHRIATGLNIPILDCALGHAYLSYCADDTREQIAGILVERDAPARCIALHQQYVNELVVATRRRGYGVSPKIFKLDPSTDPSKFSALAVPVYCRGRIIGSMNVVFFASAVSPAEAERRFLPALLDAARAIEADSEGEPRPTHAPCAVPERSRAPH